MGTFGRKVLAVSKENCHSERLVFGARNLLLRRKRKQIPRFARNDKLEDGDGNWELRTGN